MTMWSAPVSASKLTLAWSWRPVSFSTATICADLVATVAEPLRARSSTTWQALWVVFGTRGIDTSAPSDGTRPVGARSARDGSRHRPLRRRAVAELPAVVPAPAPYGDVVRWRGILHERARMRTAGGHRLHAEDETGLH